MESSKTNTSRKRIILSQIVACLALDFLLIGLGMSVSFVTVVLPEVLDAKEGLSMNEKQASWFGSMAFLCQPLGSIFSGPILDYFGRKKALFLVNIPHVIAWLLVYLAWDVPSLFLGNALLGIGTGVMEAPSVTYVAEVSDPQIRGMLTTSTTAFTSFGMFVAYLLGSVLPWRQAALVSLIVPLTTMALVFIIPETPIWLISKGRHKDALRSLCRLRGWAKPKDVQEEFDQLVHYSEIIHQCSLCLKEGRNMNSCSHLNDNFIRKIVLKFRYVFLKKETIRPFILVMAYFLFHSMGGLVPLRPNMVNICKALGMKYDTKMIIILVGVITIVMNLLSVIIVRMVGKRKLILSSLLAMACSCLGISVYAAINLPPDVFSYEVDTFPNKKETLPVLLFMLLVCFHGLGIPWVLLSEVFPFRSRGMATGLAAAFSYVIFFLASKTNYNLEAHFHLTGTFTIYAGFGIVGTVYLYFFLPETENKSLIEIEAYYKDGQRIFADDFLINAFRKKLRTTSGNGANSPMLTR